ncbi:MAG: hypothetical protein K2N25_04765 [Muribaculaceae bacterium]|nr:hypothetical protein [Muribaculaceae bacterium]
MEHAQIYHDLAEAVRIALRDFGEGILKEDRLIGILKDYHGFQCFPQGEFIVRTLIYDGSLNRIYSVVLNKKDQITDFSHRETERIARQYGFSYSLIKTILKSLLLGMGVEIHPSSDGLQLPGRTPSPTGKKTGSVNSKPSTSGSSYQRRNAQSAANTTVTNNGGTVGNPNGGASNIMNVFLGVGTAFTLMVLGPVLMLKGCDGNESEYMPRYETYTVSDIIDTNAGDFPDTSNIHYSTVEKEAVKQKGLEEKQTTKVKKPIDPRFQNPDGTYKQPWEYSKYLDDDESEEYEEGYEDGYDDAMDEM